MDNLMMILPNPRQYDVTPIQIGHEKCGPNHFYGPHKRGFYVLHILESGEGIFKIQGKTYNLKRGDAFLVPPNLDIFYQADAQNPYEYYWFAFQGVGIKEHLAKTGLLKNGEYVKNVGDKCDGIINLMKDLISLEKTSERNDFLFMSGFFKLLAELTSENTEYEMKEGYDNLYEMTNVYIEINYMSSINIDMMAAYVGMHRSNLYRFFKKHFGKSPSEYILDFRLGKAYSLITSTDMLIKQIALSCGFPDLSYFYKVFKRKYAGSPSQIRAEKSRKTQQLSI